MKSKCKIKLTPVSFFWEQSSRKEQEACLVSIAPRFNVGNKLKTKMALAIQKIKCVAKAKFCFHLDTVLKDGTMKINHSRVLRMSLTSCSFLFFFLLKINCFGQIEQYNYKRALTGINEQWHAIPLPNEVYGKVKKDFSDIRIFGITKNDTIEAPYVLKHTADQFIENPIQFEVINMVNNEDGYFFTFKIPSNKTINYIDLNFLENNFDQKIKLEGSQDLQDWFTVIDDYRIVSVKNEWTDYAFSTLRFPDAKYRYFRIFIKENLQFESATISSHQFIKGEYNNYSTKSFQVKENKKRKQTIVDIDLGMAVPVHQFNIEVDENFDYYRPITIQYLKDSIRTQHGWKPQFRRWTSGTLSSFEKNQFQHNNIIARHFRIIVNNYDNEPVPIKSVKAKGYAYELQVRFSQSAHYFLTYGNSTVRQPRYDLNQFLDKIPDGLPTVKIGREQFIQSPEIKEMKVEPLFKNKLWLWLVMATIICLLGGFTLSMMKGKS